MIGSILVVGRRRTHGKSDETNPLCMWGSVDVEVQGAPEVLWKARKSNGMCEKPIPQPEILSEEGTKLKWGWAWGWKLINGERAGNGSASRIDIVWDNQ